MTPLLTSRSPRAELVADSSLGVGNSLRLVVEAGLQPDRPLLTLDADVGDHPAGQSLTVRETDAVVDARAARLRASGIRPRTPVGVYASSAADQLLTIVALLRIGAIAAPVNRNITGAIAADYLHRVGASCVVADDSHRDALRVNGWSGPIVGVDEIAGDTTEPPPAHFRYHPEDAALITHTSGTTGRPKAVLASHGGLFASVRHRLSLPRARGMSRVLSALPVNHAAMVILFNLALCGGSELIVSADQTAPEILTLIDRHRPTAVLGFAATWPELLAQDISGYHTDSVELWWNTGDCAHEAHIRQLVRLGSRATVTSEGVRRVPGSLFIDALGSTEMGHSQFFITHTPESDNYRRCIGRPHAFSQISVFADDGSVVTRGEVGQLGVRSPTTSVAYWNDSATTAQTRHDGYFLTGDLVYQDTDGLYYHLDRMADAVTLPDGSSIYTAQCEELILAALPDLIDVSVVSIADPAAGARTRVLLQCRDDRRRPPTDHVLDALPAHVAATVVAIDVVGHDEIPFGATGKVRKVALRERLGAASRATSADGIGVSTPEATR